LRLLLDEMYSAMHAAALEAAGMDVVTAIQLGFAGRSDVEVFAAACEQARAVLTENVADFSQISADHLMSGEHHPGVLIALSSRFSRRPAGVGKLVAAVVGISDRALDDLVLYLETTRS
jgi:Domain of unknown function (DUF5615)